MCWREREREIFEKRGGKVMPEDMESEDAKRGAKGRMEGWGNRRNFCA